MRKKVLAVFLIILLSLSMLSACTGKEVVTSADETTEAVTTQAMPATLAPTTPPETTPSETAPPETTPTETTPSETAPSETEPPAPIDPDTLMFTEEEYPKVDGSTSTKPLAKSIQEEFTGAENVEIKHSKSHQSYLNVIDGLCDMILAVEPSPDEYAYAAEKGVTLDVQKVTNEGFVFFVNKRNPIDSLTLEQIRGIYSGKITNWKDVGGLDAEIVAFQRPRNSGSQTGMESLVMGDIPMMEPVTGTVADTMNEIVDVISAFDSGENAIGYSYYYYANTMYLGENVKLIAVEGVKPNNTTIREGQYPLLTAYYAITRKGDVSENTAKLIQGILSERGQRAVQRAGYVPVIDVGSYDPEKPETSTEKTVSLNDTYTTNPIMVAARTDTFEGHEYKYAEVLGLSDAALLEKINRMLHDDAEASLRQGLEKAAHGEVHAQSGILVTASFNNVLSLYSFNYFSKQNVSNYFVKVGTNIRLDTGERLRLQDLFRTDTEGKDIFNADFYGEMVFETAHASSGYGTPLIDYSDAEDRILSIIQDYNDGKEFNFCFSPREVQLFGILEEENGDKWLDLWFTHCMEEVTIYHKYEDQEVPYDGTFPASSGFPALTDRGILYLGALEKTNDYILDIGLYFTTEIDLPDVVREKAVELYLQYADYVRRELEEKAAQGIYCLYNPTAEMRLPSWWGGEGDYSLGISNYYVETDSREKLNEYYEKMLRGTRDPHFEFWHKNHDIFTAETENVKTKSLDYTLDEEGNILKTEGEVPPETSDVPEKEPVIERTVRLTETYDMAGIGYTTITEENIGYMFTYPVIDGLSDGSVEEKINQVLQEDAEALLQEAQEIVDSEENAQIYAVYPELQSAMQDTISVTQTAAVWIPRKGFQWIRRYDNFSLKTGEPIGFYDLFRKTTKGKSIFNSSAYKPILELIATAENRYSQGGRRIEDYGDVEDVMLDLILDFDDRKDFGYGFTPSELKLYIDFGNGPEEVAIPLESFRTELTVFGKYVSEESLYTGEYPAVKDIPVFVNYMYYEDVVFEKTDRYYLNLRATFPSGSGEVDRSAFLRFFEEQLNTARKKIAEAEAKGTYLLYEARYAPIAYLDDDYLYDGTAYRQMLPFQTVCLGTDSGTEFEALYQKVLQKLRAGGVYDNPLRALHAEEAFSETLNYEEETRTFYLLDGASDFEPFHIDRISVKELEGKTEQEILDILVGRGLMVKTTDGDPLFKVKNVMNYISFDPEILKTEGAQLGDPLTDRILSMIGP